MRPLHFIKEPLMHREYNAVLYPAWRGQEERVKRAYDTLLEGSIIIIPFNELFFSSCGVELIDRYGVWWCLFV